MEETIINIMNNYSSDGFYIAGNIPATKYNNLKQEIPLPSSVKILALIDTTVMGSAKNGMAITTDGLYWKNDWTTKTMRNFLSWNELVESDFAISKKTYDLELAPGCLFNMASCSMKKDKLINLINQITIELKRKMTEAIPTINSYDSLIAETIAIILASDKEDENNNVETAIALIENDQNVSSTDFVISKVTELTEQYLGFIEKSAGVFKLKVVNFSNTLASSLSIDHRDSLIVIIETLTDGNEKKQSVGNILIQKIQK